MEVLVAIIGSGALSAFISGLFTIINSHKDKSTAISKGVQQLLYDRLKYLCKAHIQRGYIATNDLDDLERMFKIYHDELGGNGFIKDLMCEVRELPLKPAFFYKQGQNERLGEEEK